MDKYFDFSGIQPLKGIFNSDNISLRVSFDMVIEGMVQPIQQTLKFNLENFKIKLDDSQVMGNAYDELDIVKSLLYGNFKEGSDFVSFKFIDPNVVINDGNVTPYKIVYDKIVKVYVTAIFPVPITN